MKAIMDQFGKYIWPAVTFILGLIVKNIFDLYRNRISRLQYSISKSFLGASGHDNYFGKVQILYNDKQVNNLYLCNINLVNTSNKDFKDIEITVWTEVNNTILASSALKSGTINVLTLTQKYLDECKKITEHNVRLLWSRRPYVVPVLNRDDSITFSCLVTSPNKVEPNVYLDCEYPGLRIEATFVKPQLFWGENQGIAAIYGLIVTAIASVFVTHYFQSKAIIASIVFLLAAFLLIPGVITVKIMKRIKKIIR